MSPTAWKVKAQIQANTEQKDHQVSDTNEIKAVYLSIYIYVNLPSKMSFYNTSTIVLWIFANFYLKEKYTYLYAMLYVVLHKFQIYLDKPTYNSPKNKEKKIY